MCRIDHQKQKKQTKTYTAAAAAESKKALRKKKRNLCCSETEDSMKIDELLAMVGKNVPNAGALKYKKPAFMLMMHLRRKKKKKKKEEAKYRGFRGCRGGRGEGCSRQRHPRRQRVQSVSERRTSQNAEPNSLRRQNEGKYYREWEVGGGGGVQWRHGGLV